MALPFDAWLQQLNLAGVGILPAGEISINRGLDFSRGIALEGDYTGATVSAALRISPDAPDPVTVAFTVSALSVSGGFTSFTISLTQGQTAALPADGDGDGKAELAFDLLFKPAGGTGGRLLAGVATVTGKVTNAI